MQLGADSWHVVFFLKEKKKLFSIMSRVQTHFTSFSEIATKWIQFKNESSYFFLILTNWCKPLTALIAFSCVASVECSWLFLSFHILYAYYLIFFWRPWLFSAWNWIVIAALPLTKSAEQRNKRVASSMVNQQRSTLIIILEYNPWMRFRED